MEELISALQATIDYLRKSDDSLYAKQANEELISALEYILKSLNQHGIFDKDELGLIFAPTGSLQEIAIDNSWGEEFIQFSAIVDKYVKK